MPDTPNLISSRSSVGLGPIAAVQSIAIINGKPSIWGDGALSVIEHSGLLEDMAEVYEHDETQGVIAVCTMKRRSRATPAVNRFSTAMAEQAGLTRIEGPWQSYPERMLRMRARSWTMRDAFADVLRGLHIREEVEDLIRKERLPRSAAGASRPKSGHATGPMASVTTTSADSLLPAPTDAAEIPSAPRSETRDETYILLNADAAFTEVTGAAALRAEFERLIFDKHLTAKQVLGVWESNEGARGVLEATWGEGSLRKLEDYVISLQDARPLRPCDGPMETEEAEARTTVARGVQVARGPEAVADLRVDIDPTWGVQKIFQRYREALERFALKTGTKTSEIAGFRQANATIEGRLRAILPERMAQIDARYAAGDGEGGPHVLPSSLLTEEVSPVKGSVA